MADELVVSGCHAPELFEFAEEAFDTVTLLVEAWVAGVLDGPVGARGDDGLGSDLAQCLVEVVGVVGLVGDDGGGLEAIEESGGLDDVAAMARRQDEADG